jgi:hypothetical protein
MREILQQHENDLGGGLMTESMEIDHSVLFSGASLKLGEAHWYVSKADTEMKRRQYTEKEGALPEMKLTPFADEVGPDEIHWWVFKKERKVEELEEKTRKTLASVQKLKDESSLLAKQFGTESYDKLVSRLKEFTEVHSAEINDFHDYVVWLNSKDICAPIVLFTFRIWGSTRLADRSIKIEANSVDMDEEGVRLSTEIALGLLQRGRYQLYVVHSDITSDMAESFDPERGPWGSAPMNMVVRQTSNEVLKEFAAYFEFIRDSMNNILLEIEKYQAQTTLLTSESFWRSFIEKAMEDERIEDQLWDFKETLEMWCISGQAKKESAIKFCEKAASFANAQGGVIIVGVTDKAPRTVVGVDDLENRVKSTQSVLMKHTERSEEFVRAQQVLVEDLEKRKKSCLAILISQTKDVVSVRDTKGKYSFPVRRGTGIDFESYDSIKDSKVDVVDNNYDFISVLEKFVSDD